MTVLAVLRRPRWIVGTVICTAVVVTFVSLGFWQLRRLDERRDRNEVIETRTALAPEPVEDILDASAGFGDDDGLAYRRVVARGRFDPDGEVRVRNRSLNGRPGEHVVTPLLLDDGTAVAVNRGFVARSIDAPGAPDGEVEVTGLLQDTQERQGIGPTDPTDGRLEALNRLDLARLQAQYDADLLPLWVQLATIEPASGDLPIPLPAPELSEGSHLSYAVQWFLFAGIGIVGWPVLVSRVAREQEQPDPPGPRPVDRPLEAAR